MDNEHFLARVRTAEAVTMQRYHDALVAIAKGEGEFSRDPLEHASNCIENMKRLAKDALSPPQEGSSK